MGSVVRRSLPSLFAVAAFMTAGLTASPGGAAAQSLFEQLFGWSSSTPARQPMPGIGGEPLKIRPAYAKPGKDDTEPNEHSGRRDRRSGQYRTVCVRTCDGFFFPISNSASRGDFHADADACRARCGASDARLFYHSNTGEIGDAVDLAGRSYKGLSTAFLYRKTLVDGCSCKAMPWSAAEANRHRQYAIAEGRAVPPAPSNSGPGATVIAGHYRAARIDYSSATHTGADPGDMVGVQPEPAEQPVDVASPFAAGATKAPQTRASRSENKQSRTAENQSKAEAAERQEKRPQSRQQTAQKPIKTAALPGSAPPPRRWQAAVASSASAAPPQSFLGSSGAKYTWPGDGPSRYR